MRYWVGKSYRILDESGTEKGIPLWSSWDVLWLWSSNSLRSSCSTSQARNWGSWRQLNNSHIDSLTYIWIHNYDGREFEDWLHWILSHRTGNFNYIHNCSGLSVWKWYEACSLSLIRFCVLELCFPQFQQIHLNSLQRDRLLIQSEKDILSQFAGWKPWLCVMQRFYWWVWCLQNSRYNWHHIPTFMRR